MLKEKGIKAIPISQTEGIRINDVGIDRHLLGPDINGGLENYWTRTKLPIILLLKLFNTPIGHSARILGDSHIMRAPRNDDLLELFINSSPRSLGIYVTEDGGTKFALRSAIRRQKTYHAKEPKNISTCTEFGDAQMTAAFLRDFALKAKSKVKIDGPTEEEPLVVMMTPQVIVVGEYGENGEIIGVVFRPVVGKDNRSVHGMMELLVREKEIVSKLLYNGPL